MQTANGTCYSGLCRACPVPADECQVQTGRYDPLSQQCSPTANKPNGTSCNHGYHTCLGGICEGDPVSCNAKTAEEWAGFGCVFGNPTATTVFDLGTHRRVNPTSSCEVTCPTDGGDFVVTSATGWVGCIGRGIDENCSWPQPDATDQTLVSQVSQPSISPIFTLPWMRG